jgi:hypothetical protein
MIVANRPADEEESTETKALKQDPTLLVSGSLALSMNNAAITSVKG